MPGGESMVSVSDRVATVARMTPKQRIVLSALRDTQHAAEGQPVSATRVAEVCVGPWRGRRDLVSQALWLLHAHGLAASMAGATRGWQITPAGRALLAPRRGPARTRPQVSARQPRSTDRRPGRDDRSARDAR